MAYDAEGRLRSWSDTGVTVTFAYDGEGRRVSRTKGSEVTTFFYDPEGNLAAEYGGAEPTVTGRLLVTSDALGSTRLVAKNGAAVECHDYLPFGEEIPKVGWGRESVGCWSGRTPVQFTGKERDSETGLDYFGARYMASAQGRFTSPDQPFADQHREDPQSWNMYGYVRNNPLKNTDPDGRACSSKLGNTGSGFCQRAETYARFDAMVGGQTRFFAAASAATQQLADVAVPVFGEAGTSLTTRAFLEATGESLLRVNSLAVAAITAGLVPESGPALDAKLVHLEQDTVQKGLNDFQKTDSVGFKTAISKINGLLNGNSTMAANFLKAAGGFFLPTDKAYGQILTGVRKSLGHDIDFASQKDREAIGLALVNHVRETGGCDVAGDKARGCH